jgi:putative membrane protein
LTEGARGSTERHLERTAGAVRQATAELSDSADRRTQLAADRTVLAGERTYAAWVRTGLAALASGVGARALLVPLLPEWLAKLTGSVLILFSIFCFVAAVWREMNPGAPPPRPDTRAFPSAILLTVNGFLVLVCLAALLAVWLRPA